MKKFSKYILFVLVLVFTFTMFTGFKSVDNYTVETATKSQLLTVCTKCDDTGFYLAQESQSCSNCGGDGVISGNSCTPCNGFGTEVITVKKPCNECVIVKPTATPEPTTNPPLNTPKPTPPPDKSECPVCRGFTDCPACHGDFAPDCNSCLGENKCWKCDGLGYVDKIIEYTVTYFRLEDDEWKSFHTEISTRVELLKPEYSVLFSAVTYDKDGTMRVDLNKELTGDISVYCQSILPDEITVTYMHDGSIHDKIRVKQVHIVAFNFLFAEPFGLFGNFVGWSTVENSADVILADWKPTEDTILYSVYESDLVVDEGGTSSFMTIVYWILGLVAFGLFVALLAVIFGKR